jgi:DNA-binding response OmpR family regulator
VTPHSLVVIEDDEAIGRGLDTALSGQGYQVTWCRTGDDGITASQEASVELVLLDLGLPDIDGIEVCQRLRAARPELTIVMLTARTQEMDVVAGLDAGADDYLTKPFRLAELLARTRAHLRRPRAAADAGPAAPELARVGDLVVDTASRRARIVDDEVVLRAKEFDLLAILATNAGRALTREHIMSEVWDEHWFGSTKTLDMHISALRRKLGEPPPVVITTLRGVGYRMEVP